MAPKLQRRLTDDRVYESLANRMRRKRFEMFRALLNSVPRPLRILDVGGTESFWRNMDFPAEPGITITLINVQETPVGRSNFESVKGDARDLPFREKEFDVVFSNAVIEHVGTYEDQSRMASEVRRVGRRYFVQTPNRYFPLEVHFQFPFFQFLAFEQKIWLLSHFRLGQYERIQDRDDARRLVSETRLLNKQEMIALFPEARIVMEKFMGLNKSIMALAGWSHSG